MQIVLVVKKTEQGIFNQLPLPGTVNNIYFNAKLTLYFRRQFFSMLRLAHGRGGAKHIIMHFIQLKLKFIDFHQLLKFNAAGFRYSIAAEYSVAKPKRVAYIF